MKIRSLALIPLVGLGLVAGNANAVTMITDVTITGNPTSPVGVDAPMTAFVSGSTTYNSFTPAAVSGLFSSVFVGDDSVLYPPDPTAAVATSDLNLTTGVATATNGSQYQLSGLTVSSSIYVFDWAGSDTPVFSLIDGTGSDIAGDFRITISSGDWGTPIQVDTTAHASPQNLNGILFSTFEFLATSNSGGISIGDPYAGTNATGFRIISNGGLDPIDIGLATAVPEPTALALLLPGLGLLALRRRRK